MNKQIKRSVWYIPAILIVLGLLLILASSISSFRIAREYHRGPRFAPRQTNVNSIQSWMTLSYVAKTFGVPENEFEKEFKIEPEKYHHSSIDQIAKSLNKNTDTFIGEIKEFITNFQKTHIEPPK